MPLRKQTLEEALHNQMNIISLGTLARLLSWISQSLCNTPVKRMALMDDMGAMRGPKDIASLSKAEVATGTAKC